MNRLTNISLSLSLAISALATAAVSSPALADEKHALLIGVGDYDDERITDLRAPSNDVSVMARVAGQMGVKDENITLLATGTNSDISPIKSSAKPTKAAILEALGALEKRVGNGDQVLIYVSSHGIRQPDQPAGTPGHDEADGMDEVIMPADVYTEEGNDEVLGNGLLDDELGAHIEAMRKKGAAVWLVIDACHSGGGMRSGGGKQSGHRQAKYVDPADLGLSQKPTASGAVARAATDMDFSSGAGLANLTAFYAVAPEQQALADWWLDENGNYVELDLSLLTYSISRAIESGKMRSYRDLAQQVRGSYSYQNVSIQPQFEGEFNRPILGDGFVRPRNWEVLNRNGKLVLQAGLFDFLETGAVLEVVNQRIPDQKGRFRITALDATAATLEAVDGYDPAEMLADTAGRFQAELISSPVASKVRLAIAGGADGSGQSQALQKMAGDLARIMSDEQGSGLALAEQGAGADIVVSAGQDRIWVSTSGYDPALFDPDNRNQPPYILCTADDDACQQALRKAITLQLRAKRFASAFGSANNGELNDRLRVETMVERSGAAADQSDCGALSRPDPAKMSEYSISPEELQGAPVGQCDVYWIRATNDGDKPIDVTPLYIAVDGSVTMLGGQTSRDEDLRIMPGESRIYYSRIRVTSTRGASYPTGREKIILLAVEQERDSATRSYRWLVTGSPQPQRSALSAGNDALGTFLKDSENPASRGADDASAAPANSTAILIPLDVRAER